MTVLHGHSQVFVTERERNGVNISAAHSHPACGGVSQVVKSEVFYPDIGTSLAERLRHVVSAHSVEEPVHGMARLRSQLTPAQL